MVKREIKCPHCCQWTVWQEQLQDRCKHCNGLLEQEKINKIEALASQRKLKEEIEQARIAQQNPFFRKVKQYTATIFIGFILVLTAVIVLAAG
ncbi:phage FluMu protein Com [Pedobacter africanus]|uniref:Phage FluMu protein Com n=1 Tax=Pedobacter africanus TaxID=151894 RepID=A0ACC6KSM9_9SPHI|nr:hypothetical protein [Pedobacter africanus]MDR6782350.1 phage FluMu protein Com [Pedobacter africanus]